MVIPCYRSAEIVSDAIGSVLAQSRPADEIIVVDDGSEDNTEDVCRAFGPPVRYIRQRHAGASCARNTGIAAARGNWLAFLDADDLWDPEKLELQLAALARHPEAGFAITPALVWSPDDSSCHLFRWTGSLDPDVIRAELLVRNIFTGICSSLLISRHALTAVGGFAAGRGCEDRRIAIDLLKRYRAVILGVPLVRQRPGPAHWSNPERHRQEMLSLIADYTELYGQLDPSGRLLRRARARMYERSGMHYLHNGNVRTAARDLLLAARLWPRMANPWRVLINWCLGRLKFQPGQPQQT